MLTVIQLHKGRDRDDSGGHEMAIRTSIALETLEMAILDRIFNHLEAIKVMVERAARILTHVIASPT